MTIKVSTEKELGNALKREDVSIEIIGDLAKKTIRLRATGNVAWAIAIAAIFIVVYGTVMAPAIGRTTGVLLYFTGAPAAVGILGGAATYSAIAVAAGGIGVLTSLRKYKEVSRTENSLVLKRM